MPTYSFDLSSNTRKDWIRLHLGDVEAPWIYTDEEIQAALNRGWNVGLLVLLQGLISKYAQLPERYDEGSGTMLDYRARLREWRKTLNEVKDGKIPDPLSDDPSMYSRDRGVTADNEFSW